MGPVTARLIEELGYDPDDRGDRGDWSDRSHRGDRFDRGETNSSYLPNRWLADLDPAIDVPIGALLRARDGARAVAVARLGSGRLVVVDDVCPHDGGRISDGFVEGERLVCARHGWELEVEGGRCQRARNCKLRE